MCSFGLDCSSDIPLFGWQGCEREVIEAAKGDSEEFKSESIMRLSWALVHSKRPEDVQRGIAMVEGKLCKFCREVSSVLLGSNFFNPDGILEKCKGRGEC